MRVTNMMIANRVSFNTQNSLARFLDKQTQMSTGRRINKPSDDPIGILRDLDYRNEISQVQQYVKNISRARNWVDTNNDIIYEMNNLASQAKQVAVTMADDSISTEARIAAVSEIKPLIDTLMQLGNSQFEGRYLYSGFMTDVPAFTRSSNGAVYGGDEGIIKFNIDSTIEIGVNLIGADVMLPQLSILGEDSDLNVSIIGTTLLSDLQNGQGISQVPGTIQIRDLNTGIIVPVDLSTQLTIDDVITEINTQLTANGITNMTAVISETNNAIKFETTPNGIISNSTLLENLNDGNGVDMTPGVLNVSDGGLIDVSIDLSNATSINDVITTFNTEIALAGVANVAMGLNGAGTGLEIIDSNGAPLNLTVSDVSADSSIGSNLGILGNISPTLTGTDLNPTVHFAVEEVGGTTAGELGILSEFKTTFIGNDINPNLTLTSNIADLKNGLGLGNGILDIWQGDANAQIDLNDPTIVTIQDFITAVNNTGLDITASINPSGTGIQIVNDDPYRSLTIEDGSSDKIAKEMGLFGSSDMIGSFFVLANSLENDDREAVGELIGNFQEVIDHLLNKVALVGSKGIRLDGTEKRLLAQELIFTERLSEVEDADITKLITELTTYESNYQASLLASAKIIQPSLLDFLR